MIYFPGVGAFNQPSLVGLPLYTDFLIKSGRALLIPVYKGTYERRDGFVMAPPYTTAALRDHMIQWSKDLGRSIDYLESRPDIAHDKLGYHGVSLGTAVGSVFLAMEKRLKVSIFIAGGLSMYEVHPQVDPLSFRPACQDSRFDDQWPVR